MKCDVIIQSASLEQTCESDKDVIQQLQSFAHAALPSGERKRVHLVLQNQELADVLKRLPVPRELEASTELYAYTREDLWSMRLCGIMPDSMTRLDRTPIAADSRQRVHLVIFGMSNQAESLAVHAALTAHFPNYCCDKSLRTRITIVADKASCWHHFQQRYRHLIENCYRRTVVISDDDARCTALPPKYDGQRKEFVDLEWEFVCGSNNDAAMAYKLRKWAKDEDQQLTVALCYEDDERNVSEALALPYELRETPVWTRVREDTALRWIGRSDRYNHIIPFGMHQTELPDMAPFIRMAQCINFAYQRMRVRGKEDRTDGRMLMDVAIESPTEQELQQLWNSSRLTTAKRWSNIYNAFTLRTKMHSLGHTPDTWHTLFSMTDKEVELFAEVEHNRWCVEELVLGFRPTGDEEHNAVLHDPSLRQTYKEQFVHDDLRHYTDLGMDETGMPVVRYDVALTRTLPLVAHTYYQLLTCAKDEHEAK